MTNAEELAQAAIENLIDESPYRALSLLTANFVGLACALVCAEGGDAEQEIKIDGGESRCITIHAKGGAA